MDSFNWCIDSPKYFVICESKGLNIIHFMCENKNFSKMTNFFYFRGFRGHVSVIWWRISQ